MDLKDKLLLLKGHVLISDAAKYLSVAFDYNVTEADIFRFAMENHLTMSIYCANPIMALKGKIVALEQAPVSIIGEKRNGLDLLSSGCSSFEDVLPDEIKIMKLLKYRNIFLVVEGEIIPSLHREGEVVIFEENAMLTGVYDIIANKISQLHLDQAYFALASSEIAASPIIEEGFMGLPGIIVQGKDGTIWELQEEYVGREEVDGEEEVDREEEVGFASDYWLEEENLRMLKCDKSWEENVFSLDKVFVPIGHTFTNDAYCPANQWPSKKDVFFVVRSRTLIDFKNKFLTWEPDSKSLELSSVITLPSDTTETVNLIRGKILTGRAAIMKELRVKSWTTVKNYKKRGLIIRTTPSGKPLITDTEAENFLLVSKIQLK